MKQEFEKAEVEVIEFDEKEDVVTASFTATGESASGFEPWSFLRTKERSFSAEKSTEKAGVPDGTPAFGFWQDKDH